MEKTEETSQYILATMFQVSSYQGLSHFFRQWIMGLKSGSGSRTV